MNVLPITSKKLLIVAGLFWAIAGVSILQIGIQALVGEPMARWLPMAALMIFLFFYLMIFRKMVNRNETRILGIRETKVGILRFMDKRGYVIMIFMMVLGFGLRFSELIPNWFFSFFYTGLGAALLLAGLSSLAKYIKKRITAAA